MDNIPLPPRRTIKQMLPLLLLGMDIIPRDLMVMATTLGTRHYMGETSNLAPTSLPIVGSSMYKETRVPSDDLDVLIMGPTLLTLLQTAAHTLRLNL